MSAEPAARQWILDPADPINFGDHITRKVVERRRVPISGRLSDTSFVVAEHGHPMAYQKSRKRQQILPVVRGDDDGDHGRRHAHIVARAASLLRLVRYY